jgi:hypothetical protein
MPTPGPDALPLPLLPLDTQEPLPPHYANQHEIDGYAEPTVESMAFALRDDIKDTAAVPRDWLVYRAYSVARQVGDSLLDAIDGTGTVRELLDSTRSDARPTEMKLDATLSESTAGTYSRHLGGELSVRAGALQANSNVKKFLKDKHVELQDPSDIEVLKLVHIVAHEAGHAMLGGISTKIESELKDVTPTGSMVGDYNVLASQLYLAEHPEEAFTGRWGNDVMIQEERFAEGYGQLVTGIVIDALGYQGKDKARLLDVLTLSEDFTGEHGSNQIDYLHQKIGSVALFTEVSTSASESQKYPGHLGYAKPLKPSQMVRELKELAEASKQIESLPSGDLSEWNETVSDTRQKWGIRRHLKNLQRARSDVLHPKRLIARRVGQAVAMVALSSAVGAGLGAEIADLYTVGQSDNQPMVQDNKNAGKTPDQILLEHPDTLTVVTDGSESTPVSGYTTVGPGTNG